MTNPDSTLIAMVVDRSGSMERVREATISTFNEFISGQRDEPGYAQLALTLFNDKIRVVHRATPIAHVEPLTIRSYVPVGLTALYDAVGVTIDAVGERLSGMAEHDRPGKVIFVIQTDGMENSSKDYTGDKVRQMIKHQGDTYGWTFTFLGADQKAWDNKMGIPKGNTISYDNNPIAVASVGLRVNSAVSAYRGGKGGQSVNVYGDDAVDLRQDKDDDDS
jgi:hypothetical protein